MAAGQGRFYKDIDMTLIEGHPRYQEWIASINIILDHQFPRQWNESDAVFNHRQQQFKNLNPDIQWHREQYCWTARLNDQYRLVYGWRTPTPNIPCKWTQNADGQYLKAIVKSSDSQNNALPQ